MDDKILSLMMNKPIVIPRIIFNNYKRLNITEEELIVLIFIIDLGNKIVYNPDIFVKELNIEKYKVMEILNNLSEKKIITISVEKNSSNNKREEYISLELLYSKILNLFKETKTKSIDTSDIFSVFEKEFGRTLSPMEYEIIKGWINDEKFSYEIIVEALKEATYNNVNSLSYIERILYDWSKKGIKTKEDVIKDKSNFRNNRKKTNKEIFDYNWLEDE
ncbi:MAG: DnaD domain protein [Bacilli bacterium]|nr:DnaD domain protein [Bacilli bacterium]